MEASTFQLRRHVLRMLRVAHLKFVMCDDFVPQITEGYLKIATLRSTARIGPATRNILVGGTGRPGIGARQGSRFDLRQRFPETYEQISHDGVGRHASHSFLAKFSFIDQ